MPVWSHCLRCSYERWRCGSRTIWQDRLNMVVIFPRDMMELFCSCTSQSWSTEFWSLLCKICFEGFLYGGRERISYRNAFKCLLLFERESFKKRISYRNVFKCLLLFEPFCFFLNFLNYSWQHNENQKLSFFFYRLWWQSNNELI